MDLHELYVGCRTYRRFTQEPVGEEIVREAAKIHPFSVRRITKYVSTLEVDQVLSWFMIRRVS